MNLIERASKYILGAETIKNWLGEGAATVSPELAQKRADTCASCKLNVKSGIISESIAAEIRRQVEIKNKLNLRVSGEKSLGKCAACFCENRLKIWLPLRNILPEPDERVNFDSKCWLLNEEANPNPV